jgi:V/A-type H+/Na+-transporting ATPase subunit I
MALLEMKKVALVAHIQSKNNILKTLQTLGAVEITSAAMEDLKTPAPPQSLGKLEDKLGQVREALEIIRKYDDTKTPFLAPKPEISRSGLSDMAKKLSGADEVVSKIKLFSEEMNSLKAKKQRVKTRIAQLEPYSNFDAPLETVKENAYTACLLGSIPAENAEKYAAITEEFCGSAYFETLHENKDGIYIWAVMLSQVHEKLTGELKYIGFSESYIKDLCGIPKDIISAFSSECDALEEETAEYEEKAKRFADDKQLLASIEDYLVNEIERERSKVRLGETGTAFVLEGWLVAADQDKVETALLRTAPESFIEFRAPADDENPPTAVKNSKVVEPFEAITDMYSIPSSRGYDPNKVMSFFYFLIYGMIIGDAAYGVILALGGFLVLKLKKPTGMFRRVTTIIMYCGISTIMWGLIYGTVFSIKGIPAVINQIDDAMMLLLICLGLGVVHIITGLAVGMYVEIKGGNFWAAIFDKFSWIMVIIGGIMALANIGGGIGMYILIGGFAILLLTAGRAKKGIFRKLLGGFGSIYGVTGYVSDILSYSRIFGMGLSTTVIATVFNTIAGLVMGSVIGYAFGIIILIIGHSFNIVINALGAFVHTARLQFIEFYGKFYHGDGKAFSPLRVKTKNHRLVD